VRLLLTGGAGFIGANYVRWLLGRSGRGAATALRAYQVVVLDALTYAGGLDSLEGLLDDDRVRFVRGDVCDREAVAEAMTGCDAVVHFAAETHVDRSIVGPDAFVRTNCAGTNVVCDTARDLGITRMVHVSTDEVYGSIDEGSFTEESPLRPNSLYAASKAASDLIALSYHRTHGLDVVVTRSSNNFGPYQFPEKVIPLFVVNLLDGQPVPLYGDGSNVRDWCHVEDNCAGIHAVLRSGAAGEVYNIGGGNEISNRDLADRLVRLCGRDASAIVAVADRPGHDRRYSMDCSKIQALGWSPQRDFDEALAETVAWYGRSRRWWAPRKARLARPARPTGRIQPERGTRSQDAEL